MPCQNARASAALNMIIEDRLYEFNPLPATSMSGKPILPTEYESRLAGATVLVRATLSYDLFGKRYQFYADVESLSILRPPRSSVASPLSKSPLKKCRSGVPDYVRDARKKQ
jgi:hypothetical protein